LLKGFELGKELFFLVLSGTCKIILNSLDGLFGFEVLLHFVHFNGFFHALYKKLTLLIGQVHQISGVFAHIFLKLNPFLEIILPLFLEILFVVLVELFHRESEVLQLIGSRRVQLFRLCLQLLVG
jgi:hypothetical protein